MNQEATLFTQFLAHVEKETGKTPTITDAIFHRKLAKYRHHPYPEDESRTWLSVLLREGMTDDIRHQLYPRRFDLGNTQTDFGPTATPQELLDDINGPRRKKLKGEKLGERNKRDLLGTVLKGIKKITGRSIANTPAEQPLTDLRVIKLLHRVKARKSHIFSFIALPSRPEHHTLEFKDAYPGPRNEADTLLFSDLLSYISVEIGEERLARIDRTLPSLPEALLRIEKGSTTISRTLSLMYPDDRRAKARAFRSLTESINAYAPHHECSTNSLDECIYTYLRALRFVHFAGGYEQAIKKSALPRKITRVDFELELLCFNIGKSVGRPIFWFMLVTSVNNFPDFVKEHVSEFVALIEKATGMAVERRHLRTISERAKRILHLYYHIHLGEKNCDAVWLSVLDCAAALCTVHQEQTARTEYEPYWHGQPTQAKNILLQLKIKRRIEDLYTEDYVPHGAYQILYNRWCGMHVALVNSKDEQDYLDAWMAFQVARVKKYAQCLRSNEVSVISKSLLKFSMDCLEMAADYHIQTTSLTPSIFERAGRWLSSPNEKIHQ
ncbi:hypothetical protein [Rhodanobacter sp. UC4436_H3]